MVTVEMLKGGHPLLRLSCAFATAHRGNAIDLSLPTLEEAKTLRDALSAFITFHEKVDPERRQYAEPDNWGAP